MKHHPLTAATSADEAYVREWVQRARRCGHQSQGLPYAKQAVLSGRRLEGYDITLFSPVGVDRTLLDDAIVEIKQEEEVLESIILLVPVQWLETNEEKAA